MCFKRVMTVCTALFCICPFGLPAMAQNTSENKLEGYVPPPLFGAPRSPDKPSPSSSQSEINIPIDAPRISKDILEEKRPVPFPSRRPNAPVSKQVTPEIETLPEIMPKPVSEPPVKAVLPETAHQSTPSQGVVKGPKTMPAIKADAVAAEAIDGDIDDSPTNMMERVQKQDPPKIDMAEPSKSLPHYPALDLTKPHIIIFEPQTFDLNAEQVDIIHNVVLPALQDNDLKLNIISYASPAGDGFSSDRRLSLSRALAVRGALIEKGFDPSKMNVRAMGAETTKQPYDRIELEFVPR
ncbi:MAG: OmpA family protein [Alphaproteobacteria bacterium]|nr:OmpA family protein [Alphaproteobacteria bacterium]NCQ87990.1 OmpA family protein [Alphaproteobacteria bacterium]NCT05503.1 OmpA family protein [Alphaproteobacteria bacterium]